MPIERHKPHPLMSAADIGASRAGAASDKTSDASASDSASAHGGQDGRQVDRMDAPRPKKGAVPSHRTTQPRVSSVKSTRRITPTSNAIAPGLEPEPHDEAPTTNVVELRSQVASARRHPDAEEFSPLNQVTGLDAKNLSELPLLSGLDPAQRADFIKRGALGTYPAGTLLIREGEPMAHFVSIIRGTARAFFTGSKGRFGQASLVFGPASVGHAELLRGAPALTSLKLIEKSTVWTVPAGTLLAMIGSSTKLRDNFLNETGRRLAESMALNRALFFDDTATRLAQLLCTLIDQRGLPAPAGRMIPLDLTQQDFAEALGVDLRSVNRIMVEWFAANLVVKHEKRFVVCDLDKLRALATTPQ